MARSGSLYNQLPGIDIVKKLNTCHTVYTIYIDGIPPDGTPIKVIDVLELYVTVTKVVLSAIPMVFIIVCFIFNVVFRNRK